MCFPPLYFGAVMYNDNNYLMHYGVIGMKWGVRRYQNKDGSRTPLGLRRYKGTTGADYSKSEFVGERVYTKTEAKAPKIMGAVNTGKIRRLNKRLESIEEIYDDYKKSLNYGLKENGSQKETSSVNNTSEDKQNFEKQAAKTKSNGKDKVDKMKKSSLLDWEIKRGPSNQDTKTTESKTKDEVKTEQEKITSLNQNIRKVSDREAKAMVNRLKTENEYNQLIKNIKKSNEDERRSRLDRNTAINLSNDSQNLLRNIKNLRTINAQSKEAKKLRKDLDEASKKVSEMSNEELKAATERRRLENSYYDTVANGRQTTTDIMDKIGGIVAVAGGVITIAATINSLKK